LCVCVIFFFKPSEKSRHCITNRIMWKHLHCWKTEGNETVGWIYFYHLFYFLTKETCPPTFKSLSLQRKTASLIDPCEIVVTVMKHTIKLHFFFVLGSTFSFENTLFSTRKEHCLAVSSYPIVRHGDAELRKRKGPSSSSAPLVVQWNTISSSHSFYFKLQIPFTTQKHSHLPAQSCNHWVAVINLSFPQLMNTRIKAMEFLHILQYFC